MKYDPKIHHRKSIRLKNYDYAQAGLYFVTICTQNYKCLFGEIVNDEMVLNIAGKMINRIWLDLPNQHNNTNLHEDIVMPNNFHGIIEIVGADSISAPVSVESISAPVTESESGTDMESAPTEVNKFGLPCFIQTFKRFMTIEYIKMIKQNILPRFNKKLWQRNYWERIIRNENEYCQISDYIKNNPARWHEDNLNLS